MLVANAVDITDLVRQNHKGNINTIPLSSLEEKFIDHGLDEGSFGVFKVTFSDDTYRIYFDYPTDLTMTKAREVAKEALPFNAD